MSILRTSTCSKYLWGIRLLISELWAQHEAKAEIVVPVAWSGVVAIRNATVSRVVVPTATAVHTV